MSEAGLLVNDAEADRVAARNTDRIIVQLATGKVAFVNGLYLRAAFS
jgi:hypothetical protein